METGLLIDNEDISAAEGGTFDRRNPMTGDLATRAAAARKADVDIAVASCAEAFSSWSQTLPSKRRAILNRAADVLDANAGRFIEAGMSETGGTRTWIGFNVKLAANILRDAAAMVTQVKGEILPSDKPGTFSMAQRRPVGVLVGMAPWNAPVILAVRSFAMAIACGNTVVLKASEKCPAMHRLIGDCMVEAGLPAGVLNILTHTSEDAPEVVNALVDHPLTRRINFTGSTRVGRIIAKRAAEHLKPCLLELGGKAPFVVLEDADIPAAVDGAIFSAFMNQGQICMSTEKVVVVDEIADEFAVAFAERAKALVPGHPTEQVDLGSVVDRDTVDHVGRLIEDALSKGAELLCGGAPEAGTIMPASIVDRVTPEMELYSAESFGPVTAMIRARDADHAIDIANDTQYGLSSAIFSRNTRRAMQLADRIQSGICHINGPTVGDEAHIPFGGVKSSGYGRFGGNYGLNEFTEVRWITVEDPDQHYPI
ncbi:aldehyde dehydrogenase [Roseibium sp. SCPC15]|uniref:aldehyde dehydrogenase n=1 Tax=Roseibium sp. SCP15 TaxID=3141376 RepID=UPI00333C1BE3